MQEFHLNLGDKSDNYYHQAFIFQTLHSPRRADFGSQGPVHKHSFFAVCRHCHVDVLKGIADLSYVPSMSFRCIKCSRRSSNEKSDTIHSHFIRKNIRRRKYRVIVVAAEVFRVIQRSVRHTALVISMFMDLRSIQILSIHDICCVTRHQRTLQPNSENNGYLERHT